jgi:hypothetical protein
MGVIIAIPPQPSDSTNVLKTPSVNVAELIAPLIIPDDLTNAENRLCAASENYEVALFDFFAKTT